MEFGERLRWKSPRGASHNVLLEPRWHEGVWLGQHWSGPTHYVFDPEAKAVVEVRAVQRVPAGERWRLESLQAVCAWPRHQDPLEDGEARIVPDDAPRGEPPAAPALRPPLPVALRREDFTLYGYTEGCVKCAKMRAGHTGQGYNHTDPCRNRVTAHLKSAGDPRVDAAERRWAERIRAEGVHDEPAVQPAPESFGEDVPRVSREGGCPAPEDPLVHPAPQAPDGVREQHPEPDNSMEEDTEHPEEARMDCMCLIMSCINNQ